MNPRLARRVPFLICAGVLAVIWSLRLAAWWYSERASRAGSVNGYGTVLQEIFGFVERLELGTCDSRMRLVSRQPRRLANNLGLVGLDEESLDYTATNGGFRWPLPRFYHAQVLEELRQQGAKAVLFDILFAETNRDCQETRRQLADGGWVSSDEYFARSLGAATDTILVALPKTVESGLMMPAPLFRTQAAQVAVGSRIMDLDPVVRRIRPVVDLPLAQGGSERLWHGGFVLAARELGLDLERSKFEPGWITMMDSNGLARLRVPVDAQTNFIIPWLISKDHEALYYENYGDVLRTADSRRTGGTAKPTWQGRLVVVASLISGNNVKDTGATPLEADTPLAGTFWNVANSLITGQFVRRTSLPVDLAMLTLLTLVPAALSWRLRTWWATAAVALFAAAYVAFAFLLFLRTGWLIPVVLPVVGALVMTHVALLTWRGINELLSRSVVRNFWQRALSENVFAQWEHQLEERAGGAHRRVTIAFADLRGFTSIVDESHRAVEEYSRRAETDTPAAQAFARKEAEESMATINLYLAEIAHIFKAHDGTFDKYIGDCVMAFWGAPMPQRSHALACVKASIAAQCRVRELNESRRQTENYPEKKDGQPLQRQLPLLSFGVGIHTGDVTAGTLGGGNLVSNYTVFGREVNIANRLERLAEGGQILISQATFEELRRDAPELASRCRALEPKFLKGIQEPVPVFEVPWTPPAGPEAKNPASSSH